MRSCMLVFALAGSVGLVSCTAGVQESGGSPAKDGASGSPAATGKLITLDVKGMV